MSSRRAVGVVGLGAMGEPIATHLARAGHVVVVVDPDESATARVARTPGVRVAASPAEAAAECEVVLVVVGDDDQVRDVVAGPRGVTTAGAATTVLICSTVQPDTVRDLAGRAAEHGVALLDAALVGGLRGAHAGGLTVLVGGDPEALDRVRPEMRAWAKSVHHLGPLGAGQVAKSANNLIHWAQVCAIHEAFRLAERAGLSVPRLRSALQDGPVDSRALHEMEQMRFTWWAKDLHGYAELADELGADRSVGDLCSRLMPHITVESVAALLHPEDRQP